MRRKFGKSNLTEEIKAKIIPKYQIEDHKIGITISKTKSKIDVLGKESKQLRKLINKWTKVLTKLIPWDSLLEGKILMLYKDITTKSETLHLR